MPRLEPKHKGRHKRSAVYRRGMKRGTIIGHTRQRGQPYRGRPYRARVPAELTALPHGSVKITRLPPLPTPIPSAASRRSRDRFTSRRRRNALSPSASRALVRQDPRIFDAPFVLAPKKLARNSRPCRSRSDVPFHVLPAIGSSKTMAEAKIAPRADSAWEFLVLLKPKKPRCE